jgi:hypothetical protein
MGEAMIVVHIIHDDGFPLCGFGYGKLPRDWPEGHEWIGREGAETSNCAKMPRQGLARANEEEEGEAVSGILLIGPEEQRAIDDAIQRAREKPTARGALLGDWLPISGRPYKSAPGGATWRSGYAAVCKTVYTSSILVVASNHPIDFTKLFHSPSVPSS